MIGQTRAVLDGYERYKETVLNDSGHGPHLDQPDRFLEALTDHLSGA